MGCAFAGPARVSKNCVSHLTTKLALVEPTLANYPRADSACLLAAARFRGNNRPSSSIGAIDLKKVKAARKTGKRREWTKADLRELKDHSKARTPVVKIAKLTKRSVGALRQKALHMGIGLGHRR